MRLSIRVKQIAGVTAIVGVSVVVLSALYVTRLSTVVLHENYQRGQLLAKSTWHRAREVAIANPDPYAAFREDAGMRAILASSLYGESVTGATIVDQQGVVVADSDETQIGKQLPERPDLAEVVDAGPIDKLRIIYSRDGQTLEVRQPMQLGTESLGTIRIGVSTLLMRKALTESLRPALLTAAAALVISVFVAALLSQLLLRPIHVIRSGLTRLGKGEFGVTLDLPPGDEFGELGTFFNTVSQQLSADRTLLAGQKANLQVAVEHLEDAVALFNPSGELLFTNPAMQATLPAHAIGRAMQGLLPTGHPYRTIVEETLASRRSRGPVQVDGTRNAEPGTDGDLLLLTHAIAGTDGELVGVLLVSRNLAYLSRMQSTLAYSRKLVALGRLTAGIAHEVKNPLNAMMIHLELLRTKIRNGLIAPVRDAQPVGSAATGLGLAASGTRAAATLSPGVQGALQHVEIIESEIRRLDEVVQGFLKFSRPEDLRLQPVRVAAIFDEILPVITPEAEKNNVRITIECPANATVNADGSMLRQAFLNLAINACQAMPAGGSLRLACAPASRDRVEVRFEDSGIGIAPQNLEKIFDLYFTTKDHGTGIGLSMVYRIIQLHDGDIEVQSTPGRGTTFRVLLPKANEI
jgi:signal transduction histidine kinase